VTGERSSQAGWRGPSKTAVQAAVTGGRIHQFLWRRSRAASNAKKELSGEERLRNRSRPSQVVQVRFELEQIAVTQRVNGCYCASARSERLWRFRESGVGQMKDVERRDKVSVRTGEDTRLGKACENLPKRWRCYKRHRWLVSQMQPES